MKPGTTDSSPVSTSETTERTGDGHGRHRGVRFGGVANVEEFTEWRWFTVQEQQAGLPY
jgi:hypothetical protein